MADKLRLAVDIGGTFTDLVLEGPRSTWSAKVLTTPEAPELGVLDGITRILGEAGADPADVGLVIHGTTLATNALIERKGARTALIVTDGFRDSIEIAYEHRFEQYDLYMERPVPLVPRQLRFTVPERMAADGTVLRALDEAAVRALAPELVKAGIQSVAICFLHSYANPDHERRVRQLLAPALPELSITLSSDVCPEIREYERMSTAAANAYIQPLMAGYLRRLQDEIRRRGIPGPLLLIMSSGGVTTVETAVRIPIRLVESGPAGGVIFAQHVAAETGITRALSIDMGGTTAKLTLIDDLKPQYSRAFEVARQYRFLKGSGLPIRIPVIDMVEIGAGGGSIARLDALNRITVGPDSSGAVPGPACYGRGGKAPTVTDADLVLGRIEAGQFAGGQFAGGKIRLDPALAEKAVGSVIAGPLRLPLAVGAAGIAEIVDETMANAARVHAVENGKDTAGRTLIVSGGAAPLHATRLAEKLGITDIIVPVGAGVGSAYGFLKAPIAYEVVRSRLMQIHALEADVVTALFDEMRQEALTVVRLGAPDEPLAETRAAFMRYRGQGHEIAVELPNRAYGADDADDMRRRFEAKYKAVFGRIIPGLDVEALSWTLTLATDRPLPVALQPAPAAEQSGRASPAPIGQRRMFDPGAEATLDANVFARSSLKAGMSVAGPAVIVEAETATVVPPRYTASVTAAGHLRLTRSSHPGDFS